MSIIYSNEDRFLQTKPLVTIGVCVRNCEGSIKEALESIDDQDFPHNQIEVIFVDGNSSDNTVNLMLNFASSLDMRIVVFKQGLPGLGVARNVVLNNATGEYIVWIDGDMIIARDFISKLVSFMQNNPQVGIAKGKHDLNPGENWIATLEMYSRAASKMVDYQTSGRNTVLGTSGCIYRAKAVARAGQFDESILGYGEDWDYEMKVRKVGWVFSTVDTKFSDYERNRLSWRFLWTKYWLRGYYSHFFCLKHKGILKHYRMFPPAGFLVGLIQSHTIFRLTRQKKVFFLPFQYVFKLSAWYVGYLESHLNSCHSFSSRA